MICAAFLLFLTGAPKIANATPCVFPAAATTSDGDYLDGKSEQDVSVAYLVKAAAGPMRGVRYTTPGQPLSILEMVAPSEWMVRDRAALVAALHSKWPKMPASNYIDPNDPNAWWLAKIVWNGSTKWIASESFVNAPSLGGVLLAGPTGCDFVAVSSLPGKPIPISGGLFDYRGTYQDDSGATGMMGLSFAKTGVADVGSYWFMPTGRPQASADMGAIVTATSDRSGLTFAMRQDHRVCTFTGHATLNADGKIRGTFTALDSCAASGKFILNRSDVP